MDDPTRRCENDTGNETRLKGLPIPSGSPTFFFPALYLFVRAVYFLNLFSRSPLS
jgi:hypothetical protein